MIWKGSSKIQRQGELGALQGAFPFVGEAYRLRLSRWAEWKTDLRETTSQLAVRVGNAREGRILNAFPTPM